MHVPDRVNSEYKGSVFKVVLPKASFLSSANFYYYVPYDQFPHHFSLFHTTVKSLLLLCWLLVEVKDIFFYWRLKTSLIYHVCYIF